MKKNFRNSIFLLLLVFAILGVMTACSTQPKSVDQVHNYHRDLSSDTTQFCLDNLVGPPNPPTLTEELPELDDIQLPREQNKTLQELVEGNQIIRDRFGKYLIHTFRRDDFAAMLRRLTMSLKNWASEGRHPYIFISGTDEDHWLKQVDGFISTKLQSKKGEGVVPGAVEAALKKITDVLTPYEKFSEEMKEILENRVALQVVYNTIREAQIPANKSVEFQYELKSKGKSVKYTVTIRQTDNNRKRELKKLLKLMVDIDGTALRHGELGKRLIEQAMSTEKLIVLHRQLEELIKNPQTYNATANEIDDDLKKLYQQVTKAINNIELRSTSFGVLRVNWKILLTEMNRLSGTKFLGAWMKLSSDVVKKVFFDYFTNGKVLLAPDDALMKPEQVEVVKNLFQTVYVKFMKSEYKTYILLAPAGVALYYYVNFRMAKPSSDEPPTNVQVGTVPSATVNQGQDPNPGQAQSEPGIDVIIPDRPSNDDSVFNQFRRTFDAIKKSYNNEDERR